MRESCADIDKVTSKRNQKGKCDDMKLTLAGLKDTAAWQAAGIKLPSYDVEKLAENTRKAPPKTYTVMILASANPNF